MNFSKTTAEIPEELKPLFKRSAERMKLLQDLLWDPSFEMPGGGGSGEGGGDTRPVDPDPSSPESERGFTASGQGDNRRSLIPSWLRPYNREIVGLDPIFLEGIESIRAARGDGYSRAIEEAIRSARESRSTVDTSNLANSELVQAALEAFRTNAMPEIQNQMALAGLGRSNAYTNALAQAKAQIMVPMMQEELARRERAVDRESANRWRSVDALSGAESLRLNRLFGAGDRMTAAGRYARDVAQERADAPYQDYLRRHQLAENALFGPFGAFVPAAIGSRTRGK